MDLYYGVIQGDPGKTGEQGSPGAPGQRVGNTNSYTALFGNGNQI